MAGGKQPGVMLYFTLRPGLKALSLEEKGMLLDAIFSYGEDGIEPAFNSDRSKMESCSREYGRIRTYTFERSVYESYQFNTFQFKSFSRSASRRNEETEAGF